MLSDDFGKEAKVDDLFVAPGEGRLRTRKVQVLHRQTHEANG